MSAEETVTLRLAHAGDLAAIAGLAAEAPPAPLLVVEVGGRLHAALSLSAGVLVADPAGHSAAAVELLRARAQQLEDARRRRWRPRRRRRHRLVAPCM